MQLQQHIQQQPWSSPAAAGNLVLPQQYQASSITPGGQPDTPGSTPGGYSSLSPTDSAGGLVNNLLATQGQSQATEQLFLLQQLQHLQHLQLQQMMQQAPPRCRSQPVETPVAAAPAAPQAPAPATESRKGRKQTPKQPTEPLKCLLASATSFYQSALGEAKAAATAAEAAVSAADKAQADLAAARQEAARAKAAVQRASAAAQAAQETLGDISAAAEAAQASLTKATDFLAQVLSQVQTPAAKQQVLPQQQQQQQQVLPQQQQQQVYQALTPQSSIAAPPCMPGGLYGCSSSGGSSSSTLNQATTPAGTPAATPTDSQQTNSAGQNNWAWEAGPWGHQQEQQGNRSQLQQHSNQQQQQQMPDNDALVDWLQVLPPLSPGLNLPSSLQAEEQQQQQQQHFAAAPCFNCEDGFGLHAWPGTGRQDQQQAAKRARHESFIANSPAGATRDQQQQLQGVTGAADDVFINAAARLYGGHCTFMSC